MKRRRFLPPLLLLLGSLVFWSPVSRAQTASDGAASGLPKASHVSTVGTFRVEQFGAGSPAMVFIPGLSCGSWVWDDAVKTYAGSHTVYVVTLAGFDGLPAASGPALDGADASLLKLLTLQKLKRPIIVGHSLGGFLALRFGTEHAALVRGIVAVDGTPILPPLLRLTTAQRNAAADAFAAQVGASTPEQFATQQKATLASMITSPADVDRVAALAAKSDPKAVAAYGSELYRTDLRPQLPMLAVPTLEIAPVPTVAPPYEGPQAASASMADREAGYKTFYASLFPGAPNVTVVTIPNSKHFVMIDQPKALFDAITAFVATLPA